MCTLKQTKKQKYTFRGTNIHLLRVDKVQSFLFKGATPVMSYCTHKGTISKFVFLLTV